MPEEFGGPLALSRKAPGQFVDDDLLTSKGDNMANNRSSQMLAVMLVALGKELQGLGSMAYREHLKHGRVIKNIAFNSD